MAPHQAARGAMGMGSENKADQTPGSVKAASEL